jgi:hypothetical protein
MPSGVMYPRESVCAEHANIMQHPISEISASMENKTAAQQLLEGKTKHRSSHVFVATIMS